MNIEVKEFDRDDRIGKFLTEQWGNDYIVSDSKKLNGKDLSGFMVEENGEIIGLLTCHLEDNGSCEIVTLDSLRPNQGIGTELINRMVDKAKNDNYSKLWLVTTNDNIDAMKFYQRRGFIFEGISINAIERSRELKQNIPMIGCYDIPIRDEMIFNYPL